MRNSKEETIAVAVIAKVKNGYIISIGYDEFIARTEYDVASIIKNNLGDVEL